MLGKKKAFSLKTWKLPTSRLRKLAPDQDQLTAKKLVLEYPLVSGASFFIFFNCYV